jgi:hypothetical protein
VYLHQVVPWYREQLGLMSELLAGVSGDERVTAQLMSVVDDTVFKLRKFAALNRWVLVCLGGGSRDPAGG